MHLGLVHAQRQETTGQDRLYFTHAVNIGEMYELLDGVYDDLRDSDAATSGTAIPLLARTREYNWGSLGKKIGSLLEVEAEGDQGASLAVSIAPDRSADQSVGSVSLSGQGLTLPFSLDDSGTPPKLNDEVATTARFHLEKFGRWTCANLVFREVTSGKDVLVIGHRVSAYVEPYDME